MFAEDLREWQQIEREFAKKLIDRKLNSLEFAPDKKFTDRDIKIRFNKDWKEIERTFEIKYDRQVDKTWNVGIEYSFEWKPSGIYTSKSDYVVYKLWDRFYYADRLRLIIELSKVNKADVIWWDNDKSQMRLVNKDVFKLLTTEI